MIAAALRSRSFEDNIPDTGQREYKISYRHISRNLKYGELMQYIDPTVDKLMDYGVEEFQEHGWHTCVIKPLPSDIDRLRRFVQERASSFVMLGLFEWIKGPTATFITCRGVRIGFPDYGAMIQAKMTFSRTLGQA